MRVGDLVKVEGGTLRPEWYGEPGIVVSLNVPDVYKLAVGHWYEVALLSGTNRVIRNDMLVRISEDR
jgi:hypothetical protein